MSSVPLLENADRGQQAQTERLDYSKLFTIFTDGSALSNAKDAPAGWACFFPWHKVLRSKSMTGTNNQAELEAIRYALWWFSIKYISIPIPNNTVYVFSDSEYAINSVEGRYKGKLNTAKIKAIQMLIEELKQKSRRVEFIHCRAHTGGTDFISINNAIVDSEARRQATTKQQREKCGA